MVVVDDGVKICFGLDLDFGAGLNFGVCVGCVVWGCACGVGTGTGQDGMERGVILRRYTCRLL